MNRAVPKLSSLELQFQSTENSKLLAGVHAIALPLVVDETGARVASVKGFERTLEKITGISFENEIEKFGTPLVGKVGELIEILLSGDKTKLQKIFLVGVGTGTPSDLRKVGALLGRKVKGSSTHLLSACSADSESIKAHAVALALATYTWAEKSTPAPETPRFSIMGKFVKEIELAQIEIESVWIARNLIHTPANIATPAWLASQAKMLAKHPDVKVTVKSGEELAEFGGLRAVGNSSRIHSPRFVQVAYAPRGSKNWKHVVLVGKGITFDTGGVSLKRPYDTMMAMKSDMAGAAAILATVVAVSKLAPNVRVTALMMCAENAFSGSAQRPSDVIKHYGGTTVEVINTDAEGRLVLADGLAFADKNLDPDYLIDVATLTGAATLGLGRQYAAMYTRDAKLAKKLHEIGEISGDRVWHMPLVDDYEVALESDIADYNHTADKFHFSAGSVTAALFLEKFVGKRKWVHFDIAGPGRSEVDAGEYVKGGTGFSVRLLTEWIATL
ncbi:unannotated protein [freshwater metagenome]|jgi:leucyl aminopeptidase|uniref:Unannotated protein n=1 Tax=freshwater metagenome TaxID=449393 RepID=A0A6J6LZT9_9ZZZZ|nr:leucyl aminopeptidase family protein [Actinomycetota bacterium]MSZ61744.1 leucyl aminopeptidase family protein [Actinomycetota bacterium]